MAQPDPIAPAAPHSAANKTLTILGATGSIGASTLSLVDALRAERGDDACPIHALTANGNVKALATLARRYRPARAIVADEGAYTELKDVLAGSGVEVGAGPEALVEAAQGGADWVMAAIVGAAGLKSTLAAVRSGADVALANKEALVCAGDVFMSAVRQAGGALLPVDSEHNAIFQVLDMDRLERVEKVVLTASGGPFRTWSAEQIAAAKPEQAVAHPIWSMGAKISVDSATMMNKGLELIEAHHLFGIDGERLGAVVHPQSIVHSLVHYCDGSILAQLGAPDMRVPIACALAYPDRLPNSADRIDLTRVGALTFEAPDEQRFPALRLARSALEAGGGAGTVLNAANEIAVSRFLDRRLGFSDIPSVVEDVTSDSFASPGELTSLDDVFEMDAAARRAAIAAADRRAL